MFILKRDNIEVFRAEKTVDLVRYIHKHHSYSYDHALKFEGYSVEEIA